MNHPALLAIPVLMVADYLLTIYCAKESKDYRKYFPSQSYELNPFLRRAVDNGQWFNPRHAIAVIANTACFFLADLLLWDYPAWFEVALGSQFGLFGLLCGRHISNLLIYRYVNRHPEEISGQVRMSTEMLLKISQFHQIGLLPIFALVAVFNPMPYTIGLSLGIVLGIFIHIFWSYKARARAARVAPIIEATLVDPPLETANPGSDH